MAARNQNSERIEIRLDENKLGGAGRIRKISEALGGRLDDPTAVRWTSVVLAKGISLSSPFVGQPARSYSLPDLVLDTSQIINREFSARRPTQDFAQYFDNEDRQDQKLAVRFSSGSSKFELRAQQYLKDLIDCEKRWSLEERVVRHAAKSEAVGFSFPYRLFQIGSREQVSVQSGLARDQSIDPEKMPSIILDHYTINKSGAYEFSLPPATPEIARKLNDALIRHQRERKINYSDEKIEIHPEGLFLRCTFAHVGEEAAYGSWIIQRLSFLQELVSSGTIAGAIVEFVGRFDPEILNQIQSKNVGHLGLCPDVELVYTLPLPSAETYNVDLKEARYFNKRRPNTHDRYTDEDRLIISGVKEYLAEKSRLNPWLFGDAGKRESYSGRVNSWSESLQAQVEPHGMRRLPLEELVTLNLEAQLEKTWQRFIALANEKQGQGTRESAAPVFQSRIEFEKSVADCLERLPEFTAALRSDGYFNLSPEEKRLFLETYTDQLYALHEREQSRHETEARNRQIHQARVEQGYQGPTEGWRLQFEYQVMDMIVDMRQKQSFREKRASRDGTTAEEVEVPAHIGRTFEKQDRFTQIESVAQLLNKSKASRVIEVEIFDGESSTTQTRVLTSQALKLHLRELDRQNIERLSAHLAEPRESNDLPFPMLSIHERVFELAQLRIEQLEKEQSLREDIKKQRLREIGTAITQEPSRKQELLREKQRLTAESSLDKENHSDHIALIRANLITLMRELVPHLYLRHCLDVKSIHDYHITKLIYCVRADGTVPVEEEQPGTLKRASHSELLGGANGYGMGELVFVRFDRLFLQPADWLAFDARVTADYPNRWHLAEINNQSGHYLPPPIALPFVRNRIVRVLEEQGIATASAKLVDRLKPGLKIQNNINYWGRKGIIDS